MPLVAWRSTLSPPRFSSSLYFNATATPAISTLSLHDALPICAGLSVVDPGHGHRRGARPEHPELDAGDAAGLVAAVRPAGDRKSTRLNSSHEWISYAVFCLKKKIHLEAGGPWDNSKDCGMVRV